MSLQAWLEQRWYGGQRPGFALRALAAVYAGISAVRRHAYSAGWLRSVRLPVPVLVVGNLSVGGTGKTPLVIALCEAMAQRGWKPGVISRGYGRSTKQALLVTPDSPVEAVGDEPLLIARRSGRPVAVAARRSEAGKLLLDQADVDLLIADDGLQHYALQRDGEVLVIDGERRLGNGRLLPAGPLREGPWRAGRCDAVVLNGGAPQRGEVCMRLELGEATPLAGGDALALETFSGSEVHAVAGIGHPPRFFRALEARGLQVEGHPFPDHHAYSASDFDFDDGRPLLMTEKDAPKCRAFARGNWYVVGARAQLPESLFDTLHARLMRAKETLDG